MLSPKYVFHRKVVVCNTGLQICGVVECWMHEFLDIVLNIQEENNKKTNIEIGLELNSKSLAEYVTNLPMSHLWRNKGPPLVTTKGKSHENKIFAIRIFSVTWKTHFFYFLKRLNIRFPSAWCVKFLFPDILSFYENRRHWHTRFSGFRTPVKVRIVSTTRFSSRVNNESEKTPTSSLSVICQTVEHRSANITG